MFTVYCLMGPCGLISNKDNEDMYRRDGISTIGKLFDRQRYDVRRTKMNVDPLLRLGCAY